MKREFRSLAAVAPLMAAAVLSGCPSPAYVARPAFPVEVADVGESARFPSQVGAYRRGKIYLYAPGMTNYSIAYDRDDGGLQNAVTLYFYPRDSRMDEQFIAEKMAVLRAHPGATLLADKRTLVWKNGYSFEAFIAAFEFDGNFGRLEQRIASQLILVALPERSFKVRSSAPVAQAAAAEKGVRELLERIEWSARP